MILTCWVTDPTVVNTVSKLSVSAEKKRKEFPFKLDCFWQENSTKMVKTLKSRFLNIGTKIKDDG
jgi:hypothetical protein